ncbi:hypothetical protein RRG08_024033 [Elysia crispata]|uniref:Uncharacterized protein n=1 Tax=Elysia crispata TaxID=231223 RepID=A0AAE1DC39_9GAST|nr:hypothetical protein RRG08_024033 [Elysia crispata]
MQMTSWNVNSHTAQIVSHGRSSPSHQTFVAFKLWLRLSGTGHHKSSQQKSAWTSRQLTDNLTSFTFTMRDGQKLETCNKSKSGKYKTRQSPVAIAEDSATLTDKAAVDPLIAL